MRKMMSSMKKGTAVAMAAVMCISLAGCGGSTKKVVADKKETTATTTAAETQTETAQETETVNDSDMAEILAGTTWAGISSEQEIMVAAFDEKDVDMSYELGWDLSEEGDSYCFELTEDDTTYYLYESAAEDVDSTLNILTSYLTAEDSVDVESDDIDLSDFLAGYVGHSVIDAFMLSGISPDFETRKYCAELLGFTNYSGTSDENLALIQLMGGTVQ